MNEACVLHELADITGQGRREAMVASARANAAYELELGYVTPERARWYFNLRGWPVALDEGESIGVQVFDDA